MFNDYNSIYKRDYVPKQLRKEGAKELNERNKWRYIEFRDPISESFNRFLCVDPCDEKFSEELDSYYDKAIQKYPGFEFFTKHEPINKNTIKRDKIFDGRSVYQVVYCDLEKEVADKEYRRKNAVHLPNDIYIPLTTQKGSYRNPGSINSNAYDKTLVPRPENNLDPNYKLRKILQVTTGDSEYMGVIGKLGNRIEIEHLHGNCPPV